MIAVLKNTATREQISSLIAWFEDKGLKVNESKGEYCTVLGLIGDTSTVDIDMLQGLDIIENVTRVSETFKKANRKFHPEDTVSTVGFLTQFSQNCTKTKIFYVNTMKS